MHYRTPDGICGRYRIGKQAVMVDERPGLPLTASQARLELLVEAGGLALVVC